MLQHIVPGDLFDAVPELLMRYFLGDRTADILAVAPQPAGEILMRPLHLLVHAGSTADPLLQRTHARPRTLRPRPDRGHHAGRPRRQAHPLHRPHRIAPAVGRQLGGIAKLSRPRPYVSLDRVSPGWPGPISSACPNRAWIARRAVGPAWGSRCILFRRLRSMSTDRRR